MRSSTVIALTVLSLASCATNQPVTSCQIAPPSRTLVQKENILSAKASLEKYVSSSAGTEAAFKKSVDETYQVVGDKDAACLMLLRTVACLSEQGRTQSELSGFQEYLEDTKACERNEEALVTIDSVVQTRPSETLRFTYPPISLDLFLRNSGDSPASITSVIAKFDEHMRPERLPDNLQRLSSVYAVAIDGSGATVSGGGLDSPARAYYPNPGSPVLVVETPIAQSLPPRSTDRFRVTFTYLDSFESRGPRSQISVEVVYNGNKSAVFKPVQLIAQSRCLPLVVVGEAGPINREICRD